MNNDRGWNPSNPIWDEMGKKLSDALDDLLRGLPHPTFQEQKMPVVSDRPIPHWCDLFPIPQ